jgi:hypothetical protein
LKDKGFINNVFFNDKKKLLTFGSKKIKVSRVFFFNFRLFAIRLLQVTKFVLERRNFSFIFGFEIAHFCISQTCLSSGAAPIGRNWHYFPAGKHGRGQPAHLVIAVGKELPGRVAELGE